MATLQDIAKKAGVSRRTAAAVLSGEHKPKRPTALKRAAKVKAVASKMGYRPNAYAKAVRSGTFGSIALLLSTHLGKSRLPPQTLHGICYALSERELHLTVGELPDVRLTDSGYVPKVLREWCSDAMLINYTGEIPLKMINIIEDMDQPAVWLNRKHDHDCVYPDDAAFGRQATEAVLRAGHRRVVYVDWGTGWDRLNEAHYSQRDRQDGYEQAMKDAGLTAECLRRSDTDGNADPMESLKDTVGRLLASDNRPTAFVAYSSAYVRVLAATARSLGLGVPDDVSLVGVGASDDVLDDNMMISVVAVPEREYGRAGVLLALEKLEAPDGKRMKAVAVKPTKAVGGETITTPRETSQ
ncbi:MAG: substrate-binding domain-containing protein [Planctomycetes bacterium]|nr:substrate-binding domain-containing protein [Planctomycetota bacterium]